MTRKALVLGGVVAAAVVAGLALALLRLRPAGPAPERPAASAAALLERSRAAAQQDDWTAALSLAQEAGAAGGLAARFQVEVARQHAATRGAEWKGEAVALGFGADEAVLAAVPGGEGRRSLRVVDVGAGADRKLLTFEKQVAAVSFGRVVEGQGALLVRLDGGALVVLDLGTFERKAEFDLPPDALAAAGQDTLLIADHGLLVAGLQGGPRERLCTDGTDAFVALEVAAGMGLGLRRSGRLETWHLRDHKLVSVAEGLRAPADLGAKAFIAEDGALVAQREGKRSVAGKPESPPAALATNRSRWVATAPGPGKAGPIELWDLSARRRALVLPSLPGGVRALAFNESGRTLAALGPQGVQTWKLPVPPDPLQLLRWQPQRLVVFAPSGVLASADDTFFELATAEGSAGFTRRGWLKVTPPPPGLGPQVAFSAQGLHVAIAGADGARVAALGPTGSLSFSARVPAVGAVALSENGERLFVAAPGALQAFDVRTEKPLWRAEGSCGAVLYVAAQGGARLLCAESGGPVLSLDPQTGAVQTRRRTPPGVRALAVSAKGTTAIATGQGVVLWPAGSAVDTVLPGTGPAAQVAFSADGRLLASASLTGDLLLWDLRGPAPLLLARLAPCAGEPSSLSFSPLGVALAAACAGTAWLGAVPELPDEK